MPIPADETINYLFGDSLDQVRFKWQDEAGNAKSLVGFTAKMQVKVADFTGNALLTLTNVTGLTIIASSGFVDIDALATTMTGGTLVAGVVYRYDLEIVNGTIKKTLGRGNFVTHQQVTT